MKITEKIKILRGRGLCCKIIADILDKNYAYILDVADGGEPYESDK